MLGLLRGRGRRAAFVALAVAAGALLLVVRSVGRGRAPAFCPSRGTVRRVVDGDTFDLTNGARVRLLDVDAPEFGGEREDVAMRAADALRRMIEGRPVRMEPGPRLRDAHGRWLLYVFVEEEAKGGHPAARSSDEDGILANAELVRRGLARAKGFGDPGARFAELLDAEREAREAGRGMWAHDPPARPKPLRRGEGPP
jgi:endonuclease YncB( thermonuclease family)